MSEPIIEQLSRVIQQKTERDQRRSAEVIVRRVIDVEDCCLDVWTDWFKRPICHRQGDDKYADGYEPCANRAAFEVRGEVRARVCVEHLAWALDRYLVENKDEMEGHFGRHCSVLHRKECKERPKREAGQPFQAKDSCWMCKSAVEQEDLARQRNSRRKLRAQLKRKRIA